MDEQPMEEARYLIEQLFRREYGRISAVLIRHLNDFDLAEESIQEALAVALERWPIEGIPAKPDAWIYVVAQRKALDLIRRDRVLAEKYRALGVVETFQNAVLEDSAVMDSSIPDERLRLIFTCCHPALKIEAQIALTLRTLGGLSTVEIARAFVVGESTLAQRLVRAQQKIREAAIPYEIPDDTHLAERLAAVTAVIYLIFNEGYCSQTHGQLVRVDLANEAIRLGRLVAELLPNEPELQGLLSLMLLQNSRARARIGDGAVILLEDQNRALWDVDQINEGLHLLDRAMSFGKRGPYQIQAAIAALHAQALRPENTDWLQIVLLYQALSEFHPTPVIELNKAAAVAMAFGPAQGLAMMDRPEVSEPLSDYLWFHSSRADLLRRLGRRDEAGESYRRAAVLSTNLIEREFLEKRIKELRNP